MNKKVEFVKKERGNTYTHKAAQKQKRETHILSYPIACKKKKGRWEKQKFKRHIAACYFDSNRCLLGFSCSKDDIMAKTP